MASASRIGQVQRSELVAGQVPVHASGHVVVAGGATRVSDAGVFAAGDLVDRRFRQAITAAASGAQAAMEMAAWLQEPRPVGRWAVPGSNRGPHACKACALTS